MELELTYAAPAEIEGVRARSLRIGLAGLAACALGAYDRPDHFFRAWLVAYLLFLGIALGSMALVMIQHLTGGAWGVFRRVFEASSRTLPLMALLFLPIVLGMERLYPWTHADLVQNDEVLRHRAPYYLNTAFFLIRALIYFALWIGMTWALTRWSRRQDSGGTSVNQSLQRLSGAGLVIYALSVTFAGTDWVMSINPHWYSTLFGFLMVGGHGLAALAFTIVASTYLSRRAPMAELLKPQHFHDLGKLSLAFVMLWAYFNFSQFLLTYAANLVEEIPYFLARMSHGWQYLAIFLVVFHFAVPFLLLLSRDLKRSSNRLVAVALWMLFVRFADLYMLVSPEFAAGSGQNLHMLAGEPEGGIFVHWLDLAAPVGVGGLWLWMFFTQLSQRPMVAVGDPYLREALQGSGGH